MPAGGGGGSVKAYSGCMYFMVKFGFNHLAAAGCRIGADRIRNRKAAPPLGKRYGAVRRVCRMIPGRRPFVFTG
ncbi:hypothetical protein B2G52_06135 [Neisseria lactamica]|uniref:Uncharacterized protein n=1 Tax=Neisseria lactamica TaxID=486 RepID=A0AAU8VFI0_NEILA|nr:hypothetical protein B2G52_06135 [Neisseria lactamica]